MSTGVGAQRDVSLLLPPHYKDLVRAYLKEDIPNFDAGAFVVGDAPSQAVLLAKTNGILAGVPFFNAVFEELGCTVEWKVKEGDKVGPEQLKAGGEQVQGAEKASSEVFDTTNEHFAGRHQLAIVKGPVCRLLQGERTSLNIISRLSGIATDTKVLVDIKNKAGWKGEIAATRKVTPGFRIFEKYAVVVGGGSPHRLDLSDMTMLKDNHVWACGGSIADMVKRTRSVCGFSNKIEVECQNVEQAMEAAGAGAEIVMLDNFPPEEAKAAAEKLKEQFPHGLTVEVSGGLTKDAVAGYMGKAVDVCSFGNLTHGYGVVDFSLKILQ